MAKKGMNIDEVDILLGKLKGQADKLDTLTGQVANLKAPLESVWEGNEKEACVAYLAKLAKTMEKMSVEIMKIHGWAQKTRDNYKEAADKGEKAYSIV